MSEQGEAAARQVRPNTPDGMFIRDLPEGTKLKLKNGAVVEIVTNANDGGWLLGKFLEHEKEPAMVGTEDWVFFGDVQGEIV
jgi:hypothetical protein